MRPSMRCAPRRACVTDGWQVPVRWRFVVGTTYALGNNRLFHYTRSWRTTLLHGLLDYQAHGRVSLHPMNLYVPFVAFTRNLHNIDFSSMSSNGNISLTVQ